MHSPEKWEIKRGVLLVRQPPTTLVLRLQDVHCVRAQQLSEQAADQLGGTGFVVQIIYAANSTGITFNTLAEALVLVDALTAYMVTGTARWGTTNIDEDSWDALLSDAGMKVERTPTPINPDEVETGG